MKTALIKNESLKEKYLSKYPGANFCRSVLLNDIDVYHEYMINIAEKSQCITFGPDFRTNVASCEDLVEDWIDLERRKEINENLDYVIGIVNDKEFFIISRIWME